MESQPLLRVINEFRLLRSKGVASEESNLILLMSGVLPCTNWLHVLRR